ncbi:FG-GAP-like repeat-containing protein [Streptomyces sp. SL13]|uniref:FG-GAP-like repeat-containing protein n=1 Tax=Streptantibioticus silvisoli TaxID=2705255 RepID=A0AA90H578_9ACTN|nr:FG-GAP-like repeat-containing protein [Streptantibioticus silvisoli]MDI5970879.1 FG-GAP-like repeat-containing protein [Streptantibioticus silvisoli]
MSFPARFVSFLSRAARPQRLPRRAAFTVLTAVAAVVLALLAPGVAAAQTAVPQLRVMPLGDSITWGVGSATTSSYRAPLAGLVAQQSQYTVQYVGSQSSGTLADQANEGHSGYVISQIRDGIDGWMSAARPDVVILHIGINDLSRGVDVANAPARLADLVNRIYTDRPGTSVIMLGLIPTTPNLGSQVATYNAAAQQLQGTEQGAGQKFLYVDPPALTSAEFSDTLHPDDAGYARMAQAIYPALNQVFSSGWATGEHQLDAGTESGTTGKVRWADFDGDGKADYITIASSGAVSVYLNRGGDGHGGWSVLGQVTPGQTTDASRVRFADFDGDGRADYILLGTNGSVTVFLNRGGDGHGGWLPLGQVSTGQTSDATHVKFADFDGDGRTDYVLLGSGGAVSVWLNRGGDGSGGWSPLGQVATGQTADPGQVRFADLDGDGRADYTWISSTGAVSAYLNRGGDGYGGWLGGGQVASGLTTDATQVSMADFTGDGNADYVVGDNTTNAATVYSWAGGDGSGAWIDLGAIASGVTIG